MKVTSLAILLASLICVRANSPNPSEMQAFENMVQIVSRCLLDPEVVVVIAEFRHDAYLRDPVEKYPNRNKFDIRAIMDIQELFPVSYIRGVANSEMLNIQLNVRGISREGPQRHYVPKLNEQGTWLYFIIPVKQLPDTPLETASEASTQFKKIDPKTPPHEAAKLLGVDSWLNLGNWYELAEPYSAVLISTSVREMMPIHDYDRKFLQNNENRIQFLVARHAKSDRPSRSVVLTSQQLEQIEKLAQMFSPGRERPSAQELINLNSPFADAILKELAKRPDK